MAQKNPWLSTSCKLQSQLDEMCKLKVPPDKYLSSKIKIFKVKKSLFYPYLKQFINPGALKDYIFLEENIKREMQPPFLIQIWRIKMTSPIAPHATSYIVRRIKLSFSTT